ERHCHERGRQDREPKIWLTSRAHQTAEAHHDRDVDEGGEGSHRAEKQRLVDDEVDVVEPVLQDSNRGRQWQSDNETGQDDGKGKVLECWVACKAEWTAAPKEGRPKDSDGDHRPDIRHPFELLTLIASCPNETVHESSRRDEDQEKRSDASGDVGQVEGPAERANAEWILDAEVGAGTTRWPQRI